MNANKAVFFDRDGTLIADRGYICEYSEVEIYSHAITAVRRVNQQNYKAIVITNQSSIARGICTEHQVIRLHEQLCAAFAEQGARIDAVYYCPFLEGGEVERFARDDVCRKPSPGMLLQAAQEHQISLSGSFFIGDKAVDVLAGQRAGCRSVLVLTGFGRDEYEHMKRHHIQPDWIVENALEAVNRIFSESV